MMDWGQIVPAVETAGYFQTSLTGQVFCCGSTHSADESADYWQSSLWYVMNWPPGT
ncbi:hypothetical protein Cabys_856 [Caldithrix abyssi DSM 13497]|uniref:Uncharacterized protein n=1 Tax=Caldithrix abyssi DSM 13497 TaxID=880073 RepID=A0A1J1C4N7_CALAY|nr:hypothetical protein Cabys_856 [Caldithrix abyssi DSM 13497]